MQKLFMIFEYRMDLYNKEVEDNKYFSEAAFVGVEAIRLGIC